MKNNLLFLFILILSSSTYSQITFEKGYFINNSGQKIDCLIKNIDWKNNPTEFLFKRSKESETETATINSVKEFGIAKVSKYVRHEVDIDRSSENLDKLSTNRDPVFKKEQLFLKVLIDGYASLYLYKYKNLTRFFYKINTSPVEQLIYKSYRVNDFVQKNSAYKGQLSKTFKCSEITIKTIKNLDYQKKELVDLFVKYNLCSDNLGFTDFEKKQKKWEFNLTVRPGFNNASLDLANTLANSGAVNFDDELTFRFGIEAEFVLPFNKNKWAIIIEPTYQYFKSETTRTIQTVIADYKSIELPFGIRHYFFINKNSKIFINTSLLIDFSINSKISFDPGADLEISTAGDFVFGIGYTFKNKYAIEVRSSSNRDVLSDIVTRDSNYKTTSLILGYTLF